MKRPLSLLLTLLFICAAPSLASAEYGEWEELYSLGGPPGLSSAAFMSLGIGDLDHLYTAGMQQSGAMEITSAWRSTTGGTSWDAILKAEPSGSDECGLMELFSFMLANDAADADTAVWAGMRIDPECIEQYEFPACWFRCLLQIQPVIYYTDDAGETFQEATLNGVTMLNMLMVVDFVDDTVGYAVGMPQLLFRTQDSGRTWNKVNAPGNLLTFFNDVQFLDHETGFIISGVPEDDAKSSPEDDPLAAYNHLLHQAKWVKDPVYRLEYRDAHPAATSKGTAGKAWRTDDGGATWTLMLDEPGYSFLNIEMINDRYGFIIGEPHTGNYPLAVWRTTDGENWENITAAFPQDFGNVLKWAVAALDFQPEIGEVGFIGGAGMSLFNYVSILFYTDDGGETWQYDESVAELGNPILQLKWADPKIAYSVGFDLSVFRYTQTNVRPFADAGENRDGNVGEEMTLDGSASMDYDEDPLTYTWTLLDGPSAAIADDAAQVATFTPDQAGDYTFELSVSDGQEDDSDTVVHTITADGPPPTDDDDADDDDDDNDDNDAGDGGDDDDDNDDGCGC